MTEPGTGGAATGDAHAEGARLIQAAFEQARRSGKDDWRTMRTAVLKNRILSLNEAFTERDWGVDEFRGFLEQFRELVDIDESQRPAVVRLRTGATEPEADSTSAASGAAASGHRFQIRPDLWRSILDLQSGSVYFWNGSRAEPGPDDPDEGRPRLPTVTADDLGEWRRSFVEQVAEEGPWPEDRLLAWADSPASARFLPARLRGRWIAYLKRQVQDRLEGWFSEQGIERPTDLVVESSPAREDVETERLRRAIIQSVERMTRAELESLMLPARAAFRGRPERG